MGNMAKWGSKVFKVSPSKVLPIEGLTTTVSVKSETQNDASGTNKSNSKGLELQPVEFSATYLRALGVDPLAELNSWNSLVGKTNPLYIGGKKFGPAKLTLKKVAASDILLSTVDGTMIRCTLKFSFEQYSKPTSTSSGTSTKKTSSSSASKKSASSKKSTSSNTSAAQKAAATYAATVAKQKALKAAASKEDKAAKKTGGR